MRTLKLLLFLMIFSFSSRAEISRPDFAYPKTVDKTAKADLAAATKKKDAHAVLNALIRSMVANTLIDPASLPASIATLEKTTELFANDDLAGMFYALQAQAYMSMYTSDRWKYDRRELPLEPFPADVTEWSGQQFKLKIKELIEKSLQSPQTLSKFQTKDFKDIVETNNLGYIYYTTLLDFVASNALNVCSQSEIDIDKEAICDTALSYTRESSADFILWTSMKWRRTNGKAKDLKNLYLSHKDSEYAALLLGEYKPTAYDISFDDDFDDYFVEPIDEEESNEDMSQYKWKVQEIDQFIARHPNAPLINWLRDQRQQILRPSVQINYVGRCTPNIPIEVKVDSKNATQVELRVYDVSNITDRSIYSSKLVGRKPLFTIERQYNRTAPFEVKDTVCVTFPSNGRYAIVPFAMGQVSDSDSYVSIVDCCEIYPFAVNNIENPLLIVSNSYTGMPVPDAIAVTKNKKTIVATSTTDADGIATIDGRAIGSRYIRDIDITVGKDSYSFDNISLSASRDNTVWTNTNAKIFTDRALYHPGESVKVMAILYNQTREDGFKDKQNLATDISCRISFVDANYQEIANADARTDQFGRLICDFEIPNDGRLTGRYSIQINSAEGRTSYGRATVTVSDYKMPDFELTIESIERNQPEVGSVTITGKAAYYSGVPMQNATIDVQLSSVYFWRWLGGSQYVDAQTITTDEEGNFTVTFAKDLLEQYDESGRLFIANFSATSPSGTTASTEATFSVGKQYAINIQIANANVDGQKAFMPNIEVAAADGKTVNIDLTWQLLQDSTILAEGRIGEPIDFSAVQPGSYLLKVSPVDEELANPITHLITIYNASTDIVPGDSPVFVPETNFTIIPGDKLSICYGTKDEETFVYAILSDFNKNRQTIAQLDKQGYHTLEIDIPQDFEGGQLYVFCVKNNNLYSDRIDLKKKIIPNVKITCESFRDKLIPGQPEEWKFTISNADGKPIEAAFAMDMYNKALDALQPHSFSLAFYQGQPNSLINFSSISVYNAWNDFKAKLKSIEFETIDTPEFNFYGYTLGGYPTYRGINMMKGRVASANDLRVDMEDVCYSAAAPAGAVYDAVECEMMVEEVADGGAEKPEAESVEFREAEVPLAIWAPLLSTDENGQLIYQFTVPNANATWALNAIAWTRDMQCGNLMREFVASKPVMVAPNTPRFLRVGDKCDIAVSVINNTDSTATVKTVAELFNPVTGEVSYAQENELELTPNANATVIVPVSASATDSSIGFRVRAMNGQFSDGEQSVIPILPSLASLIETTPFYLNPGETSYSTMLPSADDARLTLTYCENPAWSVVSALPGLSHYEGKYADLAACALFSACTAKGIINDNPEIGAALKAWTENPNDSVLISMLEKNEDLKIALLNATPWVQAAHSDTERMANLAMIFSKNETDKVISDAIAVLADLQCSDGGWSWSSWYDKSSPWITMEVLYRFAYLKKYRWMPDDKRINSMLTKALKYIDSYYKKDDTDLDYAIIRPQFKDISISLNGQRVINNTIQSIIKNNRNLTNPAYKSSSAMALYYNDFKSMAKEFMASVEEFGVWSPSQGLTYPKAHSILDYARILEAFALIEPNSRAVDGLRQQLIINKQVNNWGATSTTSRVVAAILSAGTKWTVASSGATIMAGDTRIIPTNEVDKATGSLQANISEFAGQQLSIQVPGVGPSYGAVFAQFKQTMSEVKANSCEDLDIEKRMVKRDGTEWTAVSDSLAVGDLVKVTLTIHSKRDLQFVTIIDERPAAFEPVDQLPGYIFSEGTAFYRENRDATTAMNIGYLPKGTYILTYEMHVGLAGQYSSGVATIQSQYAPEISAHSSGALLNIK